ncbi:MAG: GNAT family N-acetyltransferase [Candidatus Nanohaloarchaea archaeon]|nr:GNAT family N-acetyltransferase [Candidatus Nanohaloarchaea archaeon]
MTDVTVTETEDLGLVASMAGDNEHVNAPTSHAGSKIHYLARKDGETVGTGWTRTLLRKIGVVGGMYVEEEHRGQGIGGELLEALCERLARDGCRIAVLGVHRENIAGTSFYQDHGFRTLLPWLPSLKPWLPFAGTVEERLSVPLPPKPVKIMYRKL